MKIQKCANKNEILQKVFNNNIKTTVIKIVPPITFRKAHKNENGKTWKIEWCLLHLGMNDVSDGCLAKGEGTIEKISVFQVGVKFTTSVKSVRWNYEIHFSVVPLPVARPPLHFFLTFLGARPLCDNEYTCILFKFGREGSCRSGAYAINTFLAKDFKIFILEE